MKIDPETFPPQTVTGPLYRSPITDCRSVAPAAARPGVAAAVVGTSTVFAPRVL